MEIKAGDLVRLEPLEVAQVADRPAYPFGPIRLHISDGGSVWVHRDDIEEVLPRPLEVGDRVKHYVAQAVSGVIVAIKGNKIFVDWDELAVYGDAGLNSRASPGELIRIGRP